MTVFRLWVLIVALIGLTVSAPAQAAVEPLKKVAVGLDWFANPDHGPVIVALQRGFFADAGLDVSLVTPTDSADNVAMVLDGRVAIGMSDQIRTQIEVADGSPLTVVGTLIPIPLNVILAVEGGPVATVDDLRGKRIGYSDSAAAQRGLLKIALAAHDIGIDDVTLVDVGFAQVKALLDGTVDVMTDAYRNFEPIQVTLAGKSPLVLDIEKGPIPAYSELIYIADKTTIDAEVVAAFLAAVERGARAIADDPEAGWMAFVSYDDKLDTELNKRAWAASVRFFALRPGLADRTRYDRMAAFLVEHGLIARAPPADDYLFGQSP
ncbi:MAG: ABC transporter substrate-binding protein [Hyphomicrobiales bacterium]|nr:ABC transporter substrate-binding protein [Hyphomicrobiales bacterium]